MIDFTGRKITQEEIDRVNSRIKELQMESSHVSNAQNGTGQLLVMFGTGNFQIIGAKDCLKDLGYRVQFVKAWRYLHKQCS